MFKRDTISNFLYRHLHFENDSTINKSELQIYKRIEGHFDL